MVSQVSPGRQNRLGFQVDTSEAAFAWDQALERWRTVHVAFVERMIGARPGTGGGGVEYLRKTLDLPRAFPWLWDFRTILMAPAPA